MRSVTAEQVMAAISEIAPQPRSITLLDSRRKVDMLADGRINVIADMGRGGVYELAASHADTAALASLLGAPTEGERADLVAAIEIVDQQGFYDIANVIRAYLARLRPEASR